MSDDRLPRKLAAILYADVAGYSRLTGDDEDATHRQLSDHLDLISRCVAHHRGHVMHYAGDAVLAMFDAVIDALSCAARIQSELQDRNATLPHERRVQFRIGVNLGDVIEDRGDIYGDGVNVAARLEALAEPGGLCVSESVHTAVGSRLPLAYEDIGRQAVKNIAEPVHAYRVTLQPGASLPEPPVRAAAPPSPEPRVLRRGWPIVAVVSVVAVAAFAGMLLWRERPAPHDEAGVAPMVESLPDRPSIAVLPFDNIGGDPEQEYFADGITEDLTTDLSKISGLFVIARNSAFTYKGRAVKPEQVARELGVRYVLEGSVRRSDNEIRVNSQLIDAQTGGHVWAERYDGTYDDVFALQDTVTSKIVATLAIKLTEGEQHQLTQRETNNTEAYDSFLKGWDQYLRQTPESFREAIALFEKAVELDPGYSRAYAALSLVHWQGWKRYWSSKLGHYSPHDIRFEAEEYLARAMEEPTSLALQIATAMHAQWGRYDEAITEGERAVAMDPNDADGYVALAGALNLAGHPNEALPLIEKAVRLNPHYPTSYLHELGLARFGMEEYDKAAVALERAVALNPEDRWSSRLLIATLGHLGRAVEAEAIIDRAEENWRGFDPLSVRSVAFWYPFKEPADAERLAEGLRKAGIPD